MDIENKRFRDKFLLVKRPVRTLCRALFCFCITCTGCDSPAISKYVEKRIVHSIKTNCHDEQPCLIRIKDLTDFNWDKMFVFSLDAGRGEVRDALGVDWTGYEEFNRRIVFMFKGRIVHAENDPTDIEKPINGEVDFGALDSQRFASFGPEVRFSVTKMPISHGEYYDLTEVR